MCAQYDEMFVDDKKCDSFIHFPHKPSSSQHFDDNISSPNGWMDVRKVGWLERG